MERNKVAAVLLMTGKAKTASEAMEQTNLFSEEEMKNKHKKRAVNQASKLRVAIQAVQ